MKRYPPCPAIMPNHTVCGDRQRYHINTGWANDGTIPVRSYGCANGHVRLTAEVPIPDFTTLTSLDGRLRRQRREYHRKADGYKGGIPRTQRFEDDRLHVNVTVARGRSTWKGRRAA